MSQKKDKRFRKEVRRRVDANFGVGMQALAQLVRQRPRWIPKAVWILVYVPLFERKYIRLIYKHMQ